MTSFSGTSVSTCSFQRHPFPFLRIFVSWDRRSKTILNRELPAGPRNRALHHQVSCSSFWIASSDWEAECKRSFNAFNLISGHTLIETNWVFGVRDKTFLHSWLTLCRSCWVQTNSNYRESLQYCHSMVYLNEYNLWITLMRTRD